MTGFPSSYVPGQTYRITVGHAGGSLIVNFNLTTRIGSTTGVAGTFAPVSNSALYSGADGGAYASPHAIDSAVIQWTAPAKGTGTVTLYAAAFQGSTSSSNGQSRSLSIASTEIVTNVAMDISPATTPLLFQNFPNPFNPTTAVSYQLSANGRVRLIVVSSAGQVVGTLVDGTQSAGRHVVRWDASAYPSGVYFCRLETGDFAETKKMILLR